MWMDGGGRHNVQTHFRALASHQVGGQELQFSTMSLNNYLIQLILGNYGLQISHFLMVSLTVH